MKSFESAIMLPIIVYFATAFGSFAPSPTPAEEIRKTKAAALYARKLVNQSIWGVASNNAYNFGNTPFGNVVSYSDGGTGIPYFYLTVLDQATANYSFADQRSSLSIGQYALGTCGELDPQDPPCGKVTLIGELKPVGVNSEEERFAKTALFYVHKRFEKVPEMGKFQVFKLEIMKIYVVNSYKGAPQFPSVNQYFKAKI